MKKTTTGIILICSIFLLCYSGYRAWNMSMTHDEAASFNYFYNDNIFDCLINPSKYWKSANNHWVNTFLFQKTGHLFGVNEFTLRLPNWFAHWIYIISGLLLLKKIKLSDEVFLLGFVLLNFNPFVVDFFSTARGYGLLNGFVMASITSLVFYFKDSNQGYFLASTGFACLGVLSCFTGINFLTSLIMFCGLVGIWYFFENKNSFNLFSKHFLVALIPVIITAGIVFSPISILMKQKEFLWGCDSLFETFSSMVQDSLYRQRYLSSATLLTFLLISVSFVSVALAVVFYEFYKNKKTSPIILFPAGLFLGALLILLTQNWLLGSKFFINRKSLTLIITATLALILGMKILHQKYPKIIRNGSWILIIFSLYHFSRSMNLTNTCEWWYDEYTKEMLEHIDSKRDDESQITLGVHWFFHPTATFYKTNENYDFINPLIYSKEILTEKKFDYYYVLKEDLPVLEKNYEIEKVFSSELFLLKNKNLK